MATTPNSAIRPQTARRVSAVLTAVFSSYTSSTNLAKLCDVGPNGMSWLVKGSAVPRATIAAFNVLLFWSPDNGTTLYYITRFAVPAPSAVPAAETDFGLTVSSSRYLAPAGASFWVGTDTGLAAGIVVNAEVEDA